MATYAQLQAEPVWLAQTVPPALLGLAVRLRERYGMGPNEIGSPGDNNHLTGRHRSRDWVLTSRFCTRRSYGTRDARDLAGSGSWYRAIDIGISGQTLYDACRRLDAAVRAGQLPGVAEWFGTFDGKTVVGWYEGHASTSDSSHLWHLHVGFWTGSANDAGLMDQVYRIVTGTEELSTQEDDMPAYGVVPQPDGTVYEIIAGEAPRALTKPDWDLAQKLYPHAEHPVPVTRADIDRLTAIAAERKTESVDAAAVAAALVADPALRQMLVDTSFEGSQQAETK